MAVIVENDQGHILMEQVARYPTGTTTWELPAGRIESLQREFTLRTETSLQNEDDFRNLVVAEALLRRAREVVDSEHVGFRFQQPVVHATWYFRVCEEGSGGCRAR